MPFSTIDSFETVNDFLSPGSDSEHQTAASMDGFLASVEKQAYVMALNSCHDQQNALDIVQDSMLKMVQHYSNKPADQWRPLFFKILNNRITDQHRKRGIGRLTQWFGRQASDDESVEDATDQLISPALEPGTTLESDQLRSVLESTLSGLTAKQRQAVMLRLWLGLSVKETAIAMGIAEGSVKTHLSRAVHEMRTHLQEFKPS